MNVQYLVARTYIIIIRGDNGGRVNIYFNIVIRTHADQRIDISSSFGNKVR